MMLPLLFLKIMEQDKDQKHPYPIEQGRQKDILQKMSYNRLQVEAQNMQKHIEGLTQALKEHERPFFPQTTDTNRQRLNCLYYLSTFMNEGLWYCSEKYQDHSNVQDLCENIRNMLIEMQQLIKNNDITKPK